MTSGEMSSFAAQFRRLVLDTVPTHFFGHKECVYQAYVSAYFTSAGDASTASDHRNKSAWDVRVQYRASMKDHVTKLHEYGLAFLGPYCAIVGRSLERQQGGSWVITNTYDSIKDEESRQLLYTLQTR